MLFWAIYKWLYELNDSWIWINGRVSRIFFCDIKYFFDIYFDNNSTEKVSLGIRLEFQSFDKTLINEEIEIEIQTLRNLLSHNFKAELK